APPGGRVARGALAGGGRTRRPLRVRLVGELPHAGARDVTLAFREELHHLRADEETHDERQDREDDHDLEEGHAGLVEAATTTTTTVGGGGAEHGFDLLDHLNWPIAMMGWRMENTMNATVPPMPTSMSGSSIAVTRPSRMSTSFS